MTATVFGQTMGAFALFGFEIAVLRFAMRCLATGQPTCHAAIGLPSPATPANAKAGMAQAACNNNQRQKPDLAKSRKPRYIDGACCELPVLYRSSSHQKPEMAVSGFSCPKITSKCSRLEAFRRPYMALKLLLEKDRGARCFRRSIQDQCQRSRRVSLNIRGSDQLRGILDTGGRQLAAG